MEKKHNHYITLLKKGIGKNGCNNYINKVGCAILLIAMKIILVCYYYIHLILLTQIYAKPRQTKFLEFLNVSGYVHQFIKKELVENIPKMMEDKFSECNLTTLTCNINCNAKFDETFSNSDFYFTVTKYHLNVTSDIMVRKFDSNIFVNVVNISNLKYLSSRNVELNLTTKYAYYSNVSFNYETLTFYVTLNTNVNAVNVYINMVYGLPECRKYLFLGIKSYLFQSDETISWWFNIKLLIMALIALVIIILVIFVVVIRMKNKSAHINLEKQSYEMDKKHNQYITLLKKGFIEYQTALSTVKYLGSLTSLHVVTFHSFISKLLNLEMTTNELNETNCNEFLKRFLNKEILATWIMIMEDKVKTANKKLLVTSHLVLVLYQHPLLCLQLMELSLIKAIEKSLKCQEEKLLFRSSGSIIEKFVGNWLAICLYKSFATGSVGQRYFNLYQAIKCKLDMGAVDAVTEKARNVLSFNNMMFEDISHETLTIICSVDFTITVNSPTKQQVAVQLENIEVEVLNIDTISQAKLKIVDRAIMVFGEAMENESTNEKLGHMDQWTLKDAEKLNLYFYKTSVKLKVMDVDRTSQYDDPDKTVLLLNTMKHYNFKSGNMFMLTSTVITDNLTPVPDNEFKDSTAILKHLCNDNVGGSELKESNQEAYLMVLMTTKKGILPFIEGFFKCLLNWKPPELLQLSNNSLFDSEMFMDNKLTNETNQTTNTCSTEQIKPAFSYKQDEYLKPVYYLFGLLDKINNQLNIKDPDTVKIWKKNCFILRFWTNIIVNPQFIYCVNTPICLKDSLTTIASTLMESCSQTLQSNVNKDSSVLKTLFYEEVRNHFSSWWTEFINHQLPVSEEDMVQHMFNTKEKYNFDQFYANSVNYLKNITEEICPEIINYN